MEHALKEVIKKCDHAIRQEDFDTLMNYYTDDAILVVKPGMIARGKEEIKKAFIAIAKYFNNSPVPFQTLLDADKNESEYSMDRRATYVFKKNSQGEWLCAIDNSYGTDIINK